uniref:STAS domain-containing protein n=1 Tax=Candidatus Kentrum sp. LPFa TaxID=2126335 RepID=A0A450WF00_9GAMM|nr:MAG: hypothetical protein BECKLPF1236A_GA0070988_1012717 [Candidatus Kentron sp. LPFa]VFK30790.1 MAG: hypothetical protein BECKLPF1236C_GA0070990_1011918 [Candidatus Kentron sp. LPFa]
MGSMEEVVIEIPHRFSLHDHGVFSCEEALAVFDWSLRNKNVLLDFSRCGSANYQALSLVVLYLWHLRCRCGCKINFHFSHDNTGASQMWRRMGASGWYYLLDII